MKEKELVKRLIEKNYKIAAAESCTGGLFCATLVNVPNASAVLGASFVTYASEKKTELVGVDPKTIEKCNVVSEAVAGEMAEGAAKAAGADVGVGITGLAGPGGGTEEIPVGTVCFGIFAGGQTYTRKVKFCGQRNCVRKKAVRFAINFVIEVLG